MCFSVMRITYRYWGVKLWPWRGGRGPFSPGEADREILWIVSETSLSASRHLLGVQVFSL